MGSGVDMVPIATSGAGAGTNRTPLAAHRSALPASAHDVRRRAACRAPGPGTRGAPRPRRTGRASRLPPGVIVVSAGRLAVGSDAPVHDGTRFHAGSIAKALTGEWVLEAARRGLLDLDAPCSDQAPHGVVRHATGPPHPGQRSPERAARRSARRWTRSSPGSAAMPVLGRAGSPTATPAGPPSTCSCARRRVAASPSASRPPGASCASRSDAARGHAPDPDGVPRRGPVRRSPRRQPPPVPAGGRTPTSCSTWPTGTSTRTATSLHQALVQQVRTPAVAAARAPRCSTPGARAGRRGTAATTRPSGGRASPVATASFLRCFPRQEAALGRPHQLRRRALRRARGSRALRRPAARPPATARRTSAHRPGRPPPPRWSAEELAGQYGPVPVVPAAATRCGWGPTRSAPASSPFDRAWGDTWVVRGNPPGAIPVAFDADDAATGPAWLYVGPVRGAAGR